MSKDKKNVQGEKAQDEFSLESILAEYKGSAFINGDKKTPPDVLNDQTEKILKEVVDGVTSGLFFSSDIVQDPETAVTKVSPPVAQAPTKPATRKKSPVAPDVRSSRRHDRDPRDTDAAQTVVPTSTDIPLPADEMGADTFAPMVTDTPQSSDALKPHSGDNELDENDNVVLFFENYRSPTSEPHVPESQVPEHIAIEPAMPKPQHPEQYTSEQQYPEQFTAEKQHPEPYTDEQQYPEQYPDDQQYPEQHLDDQQYPEQYQAEQYPSDLQDTIVFGAGDDEIGKPGYGDEPRETGRRSFSVFPGQKTGEGRRDTEGFDAFGDEYYDAGGFETDAFEEPALKDAASKFAKACNSISLRFTPAAIITLMMVIITFAFEANMIIPFGIGRNHLVATGMLMLCLLIVMILCIELIIRGAMTLIRGVPNAETLILFSCAFSIIAAAFSMISGASAMLPYCAVSALSLTLAAYGEKTSLRAITETLKTAASSAEPYGLQAEYNGDIDKSVLKKAYDRTDGFYNNLMHPDIAEATFRFATPILLAAALLLSVFATIAVGESVFFLQILSALLAAAAPFSALLTFSIPFGAVAKSIRKSGAAIAGWGGADDICFTDGACVTDGDLFPPGTLSLSGLKLYDDESPDKAISFTASLIVASGSGLSDVFYEVLNTQGMDLIKVEDFTCYEGGIGALIRGERVATGSAAFMNLLGVRVPDDTNMKNAVYTAVNNRLIAMFTVDYLPINSVQGALISIMKWRIKLFLAVRDFNVTPLMLEQKFRLSLDGIEYIQTKDSYSISDSKSGTQGRMAAVLTREGLGPFAEAVTGGRLLKSAALVATVISVISAAFGVLIMFYMCWTGALGSASPGNLMLFMLSMFAVVLIACGYVKCRK